MASAAILSLYLSYIAGKNGWYVGSPELGLVNFGNAHLRKNPQVRQQTC